jgi:hypothetical protein
MPTYLVRIIESRDLVGIFSADSIHELIVVIDECTEADACEYVRLPTGGVMWTDPATPIPIARAAEEDGSEPDPMPWGDATVTERWWDFLYGYATCRWKRFFPDDPRDR